MSESLSPSFLLVGDSFLIAQKIISLLKIIEKNHPGEIPQSLFQLSEVSLEEILTQARTLPFLASAQVFRLREAEELKKADLELLAKYLEHPAPSSYLIFEADELDKNHGLVKTMETTGKVFFLEERQKKSVAQHFIQEKLKYAGKSISPAALARLGEAFEDNPIFLNSALDRLITYAGKKPQITEAMVEMFEENFNRINVFDLCQALAARETAKALRLLREWLDEESEDETKLVGLLHWQIRRLWLAKVLLEKGENPNQVFKKCKIPPYQTSSFMQQLQFFSREKIEQIAEDLFRLDGKLKTGQLDPAAALEAWLVQSTS